MQEPEKVYNFWKISPVVFSIIFFFIAVHIIFSTEGERPYELLVELPLLGMVVGLVMAYPLKILFHKTMSQDQNIYMNNPGNDMTNQKETFHGAVDDFIFIKLTEKSRFLLLEIGNISLYNLLGLINPETKITGTRLTFKNDFSSNKRYERDIKHSKNIKQLLQAGILEMADNIEETDLTLPGEILKCGMFKNKTKYIAVYNSDEGMLALERLLQAAIKRGKLYEDNVLDTEDILVKAYNNHILITRQNIFEFENREDLYNHQGLTFI